MGDDFRQFCHILVVDDHSTSREALSAVIHENKYPVVATENAKNALSILSKRKHGIRIVLADTELPDMDIFEFIEIVNEQQKLPILIVCQTYEKDIMAKAIEKGAMYCLVKPVTHEDVSDLWAYVYIKEKQENTPSGLWSYPPAMNLEDEGGSSQNKNEETRVELMNEDQLKPQYQQQLQDIDKLTTVYSSMSEILKTMNALGTNKGCISSDSQGLFTKDIQEESLMFMGVHVLVVDCHITSLIATSRVLRESKYKVVAATNAKSALDILQEGKDNVQLVLMDTKLPDMDELEFIGIIGRKYKLPLIAICHSYQDPILLDALANGAVFYLRKPVTHCQARNLWQFISIYARRVIRESQSLNYLAEKNDMVEGGNGQYRQNESKIQVMDQAQIERLLRQQIFLITKQLTCIHSSLSEVINIMKALGTTEGHVSSELQIHQINFKQGQPSDDGPTITAGSYLGLGSQSSQQEEVLQIQKKSFMQDNDINLNAAACQPRQINARQEAVLQAQSPVPKISSMDSHSPHLSSGKPSSKCSLSKRTSQSRSPLLKKATQQPREDSQERHAANARIPGSVLPESQLKSSSSITAQASNFPHQNSAATSSDQQQLAHYGHFNIASTISESTLISLLPNTQLVSHSTSGFLGSSNVNNSSMVGLGLTQGKIREFSQYNKGLEVLSAKKYTFPSTNYGKKFSSGSSSDEQSIALPLGAISSQNQQQQLHWSRLPDSLIESTPTIGISIGNQQDISQSPLILSPQMEQRSYMDRESLRTLEVWSKEPCPPQELQTEEVELLWAPSVLPPYSPTLACQSLQIPAASKQGRQTEEQQLQHTSSKYAGLCLSDLENLAFRPLPVATQPSQPSDCQDLIFDLDDQQIADLLAAIQSPPHGKDT